MQPKSKYTSRYLTKYVPTPESLVLPKSSFVPSPSTHPTRLYRPSPPIGVPIAFDRSSIFFLGSSTPSRCPLRKRLEHTSRAVTNSSTLGMTSDSIVHAPSNGAPRSMKQIRTFYSDHRLTVHCLLLLISLCLLLRSALWEKCITRTHDLAEAVTRTFSAVQQHERVSNAAVFGPTEFGPSDPVEFRKEMMGFWGIILVTFVVAMS